MPISIKEIEKCFEFMTKREFEYHIHISLQNSYIYFEVPKVACSTTKLRLQQLEAKTAGLPLPSEDMSLIHNKTKSLLLSPSTIGLNKFCAMLNDNSVFKFAFVRNPYTRILSAFLSKIKGKKSYQRQKIGQILDVEIEQDITFKQFISAIAVQSKFDMDPHWRPQTYQLFDNLITYNFIGYFENFEQDLQKILNQISLINVDNNQPITTDIPGINTRGRKTDANQKIDEFYDLEAQSMLLNIYKNDFLNFGYSLDISTDKKQEAVY